jgi:aminoglycoside phosphotransferase (APT) family kinase protein
MGSPQQPADTYRLIVTRRNASEVLLVPSAGSWTLPRVDIERHQRLAEQLTREALRAWRIESYCLLVQAEEPACAVMDSLRQNAQPPRGTCWMLSSVAPEYCDAADAMVVRNALADVRAYACGKTCGPFAHPGWIRELFRWANEQIAPLGLRLTGKFEQRNASPTFALIRLETDEGAVWFKSTGEPNRHELPVTAGLARLFPRYLPPIFGVHQDWNGWLAAEAEGVPLDQAAGFAEWERAAAALAELQIGSIEKTAELFETKSRDLRTRALVERIDPFICRMGEFMAAQEKAEPAPLATSELATLAQALKESCSVLESIGLPDTLGHTDCNPGNIIVSDGRCVFLDWAEACVANPLLTFEYLRVYMTRCEIAPPLAAERLTAAYLRPWFAFYSPVVLRRALALAPLLAVYAFALSTDRWRTLDPVNNSTLAGYFRSLTRRMYREIVEGVERSELCLS